MKKLSLLVAAVALLAFSGCISLHNSVPEDMTALRAAADVKTTYKILGKTEASASGMVILGLIKLGDFDKVSPFPATASVGGFLPVPASPKIAIESAAAYKALDNYPDADRMLDPRWRTTVTDYVVFKQVETKVCGEAVQFKHK